MKVKKAAMKLSPYNRLLLKRIEGIMGGGQEIPIFEQNSFTNVMCKYLNL